MDTVNNVTRIVTSAGFTGDDSKAGIFIGVMVVMAIVIVGMVAFSVISSRKNKDSGDTTENKADKKDNAADK